MDNKSLNNTWLIMHYESTSSTMDRARELVAELGPDNLGLVLADNQTAGRGQHGRQWLSVESGLYFTIVNKSLKSPKELSGFSLMLGCCLVQAIKEELGIDTFLKWPNDILNSRGEKLGGILVETSVYKNDLYILSGIGLNLKGHLDGIQKNSDLESEASTSIDKQRLLLAIRSNFEKNLKAFNENGFKAFYADWNNYNLYKNKKINFQLSEDNQNQVSGICKGVDPDGYILIEDEEGVKSYFSGRIVLVG